MHAGQGFCGLWCANLLDEFRSSCSAVQPQYRVAGPGYIYPMSTIARS